MAQGIAFGLAESLLTKVASTAFEEIGLLYGVKNEFKKLENTLTIINAVLADAEEKQDKSHAVRIWIKRLEQAVYDADDLLDKFAYKDLQKRVDHRLQRQVSDFFSSSNQLAFRLQMGHAIKEIRGRLDEIANDISKFNFLSKTVTINTRFFGNRERETVSYVLTSEIIGRDREKEEILNELIGPDSNTSDSVPVMAIVGIGGLGKTSLAKLVFNDKRVAKHFEPKIWVCVSEDFDRKLIVKNILKSITDERVEELEMEHLQMRLRRNLDGKKYLLVLDDVWNEENDKWIQLEQLLMVGANGRKIVVTTRSVKVASAMGIDSPYLLNGLSNELSRELFENLAFGKELQKVHPNIIEIGKELIKRCKGVPLAIRTLGSTMGSKTSESEWLSIQNSKIWSPSSNEGGILSVLKLSYDQLSTHIKYCFAYCSIFPKDYKFEYEELIQLWIAQGYVQSLSDRYKTLEYMGDQYVKDLLSISFFQEVEVDNSGNITKFKMHDLIHDLAVGVAGSNCYCLTERNINNGDYDESIRHMSLEWHLMEELPRLLLKAKGMRTLFCPGGYDLEMGLLCQHTIMSNLTCLRVLDLHNCGIKNLSSSIGMLKHLRYLDLGYNEKMEGLPNSISNLLNLQTLNLRYCRSIKQLPRDITKLNNLRYLMMEGCEDLTQMPSEMGKLINLRYLMIDVGCRKLTHMPPGLGKLTMMQKLPIFIVGNDKTLGHSSYGRLRELKGLNDLRGEIRIRNLGRLGADDAALESKEASLKEKQHLQSLTLHWGYTESAADTAELVLETLEPHPNLKELKINGYCGGRFPSWMIKMGNVVNISLWGCRLCLLLQPLNQLLCLKFLDLSYFSALEYIQDGHPPPSSFSLTLFFPSLQKLDLRSLPKLKGWWKRRRESVSSSLTSTSSSLVFPQLTKLTIRECPMFTSMPLHPNIEELQLMSVSEKLLRELLTTTTSAAVEEEERKVHDYHHHHHQMSSSSNISSSSSYSISSKLKSLHIENIQDLEVLLPESLWKNLTSLKRLMIQSCDRLLCLTSSSSSGAGQGEGEGGGENFRSLTSLRTLEISYCAKLKFIFREVQHLPALENLTLEDCPELELSDDDGLHWQGLRSLRTLVISKIPKLVTLPVGIQHLTTLQHLKIHKSDGFLAVPDWIGNLTQLQQLRFSFCHKLASLPQEIRSLTSLQQLEIYNSPKLSEKCQNETGEDWLKIAHIPNIKFDGHMIQGTYFSPL